jgi:hypothetical protein
MVSMTAVSESPVGTNPCHTLETPPQADHSQKTVEFFDCSRKSFYVWFGWRDHLSPTAEKVTLIAILDNGKPVVRRGRKAMGS